MGLEVLDQVPDLDAIVVPVGGGGLIAGMENPHRWRFGRGPEFFVVVLFGSFSPLSCQQRRRQRHPPPPLHFHSLTIVFLLPV
jgi:hypothetical protein